MKALLVVDDEKAINNISEVLKSAGYDTIVYKWLLKALDNIEEIAPHLIVISTADYPRHWKTLAQYASSGFGDYTAQVILYSDENFSEEEQRKAETLRVRGTFGSIDVDGLDRLREILSRTDDIFSGYLTEDEQDEITVDDLVPNARRFVVTGAPDERTRESDEAGGMQETAEISAAEPDGETGGGDDSFDNLITRFEETTAEAESQTDAAPYGIGGARESDEAGGMQETAEISATEPDGEADGVDDSFDNLITRFEETTAEAESQADAAPDGIGGARDEAGEYDDAVARLEQTADDERAADRLEQLVGDEQAADKLERIAGNEEIPTVADIISGPQDYADSDSLPGIEELKKILDDNDIASEDAVTERTDCAVQEESGLTDSGEEEPGETEISVTETAADQADSDSDGRGMRDDDEEEIPSNPNEEVFEESENGDIIGETISEDGGMAEDANPPAGESESADSQNGESTMADEQSIEDKLAQIMSANKADAKEKAEALKLDTASSSVSFVFTNPITLAMVSGVARNYNGLVLEFTPDIPSFILNLSPGTKINIASMKIDGKIENVFAEVMSNDAKKLALAIKK